MKRYPIKSQNLAEVGYDPVSKTLEVIFKSSPDVLYTYKNVGLVKFVNLLTAISAGKYFQKMIRSRPLQHPYTWKKIK